MIFLQILVPAALAACVTLGVTPLVVRLAWKTRALDLPGGRKRQPGAVPRLGGVAIVSGIVGGIAVALFSQPWMPLVGRFDFSKAIPWPFLLAVVLIFALGLLDDLRGLGALPKFTVQSVAALLVIGAGWQFTALTLPFEGRFYLGGYLAPALTLLWIVGVTNAINLIDGLDGLASGIVAIVSGSLMVLAAVQGSTGTVLLTSAMAGACVGFLHHNWRPAKIYMGDCGSLTLGFLLATVSLQSTPSLKASAAVAILVPVLALGLPVIDTILVMWYRFLRGHRLVNRVARMFRADRAHLHHILIDNASERRWVMLTLYGLVVLFCSMALLVATSSSWLLGLVFLAVEVVAVVLIRRVGLTSAARRLADERLARLMEGEETSDGAAIPPEMAASETQAPVADQ